MANQMPSAPRAKVRVHYAWLAATLGLLIMIASGITYLMNQTLHLEMQVGLGLGGVLLLGAVLMRPDAVRATVTGRSVKYGSNAVLMSLAFIGILGLINFIAHKHNQEVDVTEAGLFTLSEQTIRVLESLEEPVQVIGFFSANDNALSLTQDYLERYSQYTDKLTYEFHDPILEPALAQSLEVSDYGAIVFVSGDNRQEIFGIDEQTITSGLIRVTNNVQRTLYFITGHGEHSIKDGGPEGYDTLKEALKRENYLVRQLNLASATDAIPADATALIVAGADRDLLETETQLIEDWVASGGELLLLIDPLEPIPLSQVLHDYGLAVENNFVVEDYNHSLVTLGANGLKPQVIAPLITEYPYHEITSSLNGYQSFYPFARSIAFRSANTAGLTVSPILSTSEGSWAETDLDATKPKYTPGDDYHGPLHLGAAIEDHERGMRLVVIGNAGFVTNQNIPSQMANMDLFINAVNWLAEEEELISIRPKPPQNRRLFLTPMQISLTLFSSVVLIPLLVFATGVVIWWKRR